VGTGKNERTEKMKAKKMKKILGVALMLVLVLSLLPVRERVSAATKPAKPKITLALSKDKASATLTIKKTKRAEGYQIMVKLPGAKKYTELTILELDGKKKRSFTIGNVPSGKYTVKVRGYAIQNGNTVYGKYSKAKSVTIENNNALDSEIKQGDIVTFGSFEQDGDEDNGKEPIEWIVLSNDNGKLFMVSVYALEGGIIDECFYDDDDDDDDDDDGFYHGSNSWLDNIFDGTWKNSQLRKHLNEEFLISAFNEKEIEFITDTELADSDCTDKVFLLSLDEVTNKDYGFEREADRTCAPSKAAKGVYVYKGYADYGETHVANEDKFACYYWLRTRRDANYTYDYGFYLVEDDGQIGSNACWGDEYPTGTGYDMEDELYIEDDEFGIRPALVVELKSGIENVLSKTGKTMKEEWKNAQ
jgi:hypothetical protein